MSTVLLIFLFTSSLLINSIDSSTCECHADGYAEPLRCDEASRCVCKPNVTGARCDRCAPGFFSQASTCEACSCPKSSSSGETCDAFNGQCDCLIGYRGLKCDECDSNFTREGKKCVCPKTRGYFLKNSACHSCHEGCYGKLDEFSHLPETYAKNLTNLKALREKTVDLKHRNELLYQNTSGLYTPFDFKNEFESIEASLGAFKHRNILNGINTNVSRAFEKLSDLSNQAEQPDTTPEYARILEKISKEEEALGNNQAVAEEINSEARLLIDLGDKIRELHESIGQIEAARINEFEKFLNGSIAELEAQLHRHDNAAGVGEELKDYSKILSEIRVYLNEFQRGLYPNSEPSEFYAEIENINELEADVLTAKLQEADASKYMGFLIDKKQLKDDLVFFGELLELYEVYVKIANALSEVKSAGDELNEFLRVNRASWDADDELKRELEKLERIAGELNEYKPVCPPGAVS